MGSARDGYTGGMQRRWLAPWFAFSFGWLAAVVGAQQAVDPAASPASAAAITCRVALRGQVVGCAADERPRLEVLHSDGRRNEVVTVAAGRAAAGGAFALDDVPWYRGLGWHYHWCIVVARCGDRVGIVQVRRDGGTDGLAVKLRPTRSLRGVVRDRHTQQPIAGAWVWPMIFGKLGGDEPAVWPTAPMVPWHVRTDADGSFVLRGVPAFAAYALDVGGPAHARQLVAVDAPARPIAVQLAAAGRITGRVLRADGRPAAGVDIWATGSELGYARARTGADGRYALESLAAQKFTVEVRAAVRPDVRVTGVLVSVGETVADIDLQLVESGLLVGRVVDLRSGEVPEVPDATEARVCVRRRGQEVVVSAPVAADGTFRLWAPVGAIDLVITGSTLRSVKALPCRVVAGEETRVEVKTRSLIVRQALGR